MRRLIGIAAVLAIAILGAIQFNRDNQSRQVTSAAKVAPQRALAGEEQKKRDTLIAEAERLFDAHFEARADPRKTAPKKQEAVGVFNRINQFVADFGEDPGLRTAANKAWRIVEDLEAPERERRKAQMIADDAAGRATHARSMEELMLRNWYDTTVRVSGPKNTTLTITYVLISRPLVYNLINGENFLPNLRERGFKQLILTDGYGKTWKFDL